MKKTLHIALIGAGGIGGQWAKSLEGLKGVRFKAVADVDREKAQKIAESFPGCRVFTDWKEVLKEKEIDGVIVATPHVLLAPISHKALAMGKHVLCEKPAGITVAEVAKNSRLAKQKKLVYMIGFNHRYHPAYLKAKEIADRGGIGSVCFVRARYGFGGRPGYGKEWRFKREVAGGGELLDQGMHMIDMARFFMGEFSEVEGYAENYFWGGDVEDNAFLLMRTNAGAVAQIHVSWTNWDWIHSFEIFGDKGYLAIDGLDTRYHGPERLAWGQTDPTFARPKIKEFVFKEEQKQDSMRREATAFRSAITGKASRLPTGIDAAAALRIVEEIYSTHGTATK